MTTTNTIQSIADAAAAAAVAKAKAKATVASDAFVRKHNSGALFAKADRDTGEIVSISGEFTTPEGVLIYLKGEMVDEGAISLVGSVKDHPRIPVHGLLMPQEYDDSYKGGVLTVGKKVYHLNSLPKVDRNDEPYRFVWGTNNTKRVAF